MVFNRRRLVVAVLVAAVALTAVVAAVVSATRGDHVGGPLAATSRVLVEQRVEPGQDWTWGMPINSGSTQGETRIDEIEAVGVDGIKILGVSVTRDPSVTTALGYPPAGYRVVRPNGVLVPKLSAGPFTILFGVRLAAGTDVGTIDGIRLSYHVGNDGYRTVLPWSLRLHTPGA